MKRRHGWIPDHPDKRDYVLKFKMRVAVQFPESVDLREKMPCIYDQGSLGSCVANAIGAVHQFNQMREGVSPAFVPSRLFIYYEARKLENSVQFDAGCMIRDGIKSVVKKGVCPEPEWPYVIKRFADKPSHDCYDHADEHQVLSYARVNQAEYDLKACLAGGFPFVCGITLYESFMGDDVKASGVIPFPSKDEDMVGGHAITIVGWSGGLFIGRNSWGTDWGMKGYFMIPVEYILDPDLCADIWTISSVEIDPAVAEIEK